MFGSSSPIFQAEAQIGEETIRTPDSRSAVLGVISVANLRRKNCRFSVDQIPAKTDFGNKFPFQSPSGEDPL